MTAPVLQVEAPRSAPDVDAAVRTTGLTKRFRGGQVAVDALDLVVPRGSVTGFLGPNGSGKTTTIRMLLGLVVPTSGQVELLGEPVPRASASVLPRVGALVEGPAFHPYLSGRANLVRLDAADRTVDRRTSSARIDTALDRVGLQAAAGKRFRTYSLGMKQRLGLAAALLRPRDLFILDEPTNGLDPQGTREVRTLVRELAADGCTVLVSSHLLGEIEQVCDRVVVMRAGRAVTSGTLEELALLARPSVVVETPALDAALSVLRRLGATAATADADGLRVRADLPDVAVEDVTRALVHADVPVRGIGRSGRSLEELFVELTGEGFDVVG
ncbi:MAG: transporter related protein [Frankiales bacterium]|nr:transporter related protein [Frankiales bacterium]